MAIFNATFKYYEIIVRAEFMCIHRVKLHRSNPNPTSLAVAEKLVAKPLVPHQG